jgi:hypothetical protein
MNAQVHDTGVKYVRFRTLRSKVPMSLKGRLPAHTNDR